MKRVFIIHGWGGNPQEGWFPWLKQELEQKGFQVIVPAMPHPDNPTINDWVECVKDSVQTPDNKTYFVGHSIGCQTILRYLERVSTPVGGVVLVAGFFNLTGLDTVEEKEVAKPWLQEPIDTDKIKKISKNIKVILSPGDLFVPLSEKDLFELKLNADVEIVESPGKWKHFSGSDGVTELPEALQAILSFK